MKITKAVLTLIAVVAALVLVSCAEPPTQDMDAARAAVSAAQKADAATYATAQLDEATKAVAAADAEIAAQSGKFALTRNYDKAKELIADATAKAKTAEQDAVKAKEEAKKQAEDALTAVNTAMTNVGAMMDHLANCPKKPKGFDADMKAMQGQVDALKSEVAPIEQSIKDGDYKGAESRASSLQQQISTLSTDLEGAMTKIKCPMPAPAAATATAPTKG